MFSFLQSSTDFQQRPTHLSREKHTSNRASALPAHQNIANQNSVQRDRDNRFTTTYGTAPDSPPCSSPSVSPAPRIPTSHPHSGGGYLLSNSQETLLRNGYSRPGQSSLSRSPSAASGGGGVGFDGGDSDAEHDQDREGMNNRGRKSEMDDEESLEEHGGHGGQSQASLRVRSLISDTNFRLLKSFYDINPWPKKSDLANLANRCGLKRRVVQVSESLNSNYCQIGPQFFLSSTGMVSKHASP